MVLDSPGPGFTGGRGSRLLALATTVVTAVGAVPTSPLATREKGCAGGGCPTWPAAVHLEGTFTTYTCNSPPPVPGMPSCTPSVGNITWDTLGDANDPPHSLAHLEKAFSTSTPVPGQPPVVVSSQAKFWQDCPSHKQWSDSSMNGKPFVPCTSRPALCIYRNDPISNALAACQVWNETKVGAGKHYSGSYCNFYWNNLPIPGVESTGTFDVTFAPGEVIPSKFTTNKTTTESVQGKMVQVTVSETVVVTSSNTSPDPAVFRGHCTPSGEDSEMRVL